MKVSFISVIWVIRIARLIEAIGVARIIRYESDWGL